MSIIEKIEIIDNKFGQNKVQYDLDRKTLEISALSPGNVSKYVFLASKDVLPEKDLYKKSCYNEKI